MRKQIIVFAVGIIFGLAPLNAAPAPPPSLKDQILAVDKELFALRQTTISDPEVKAAEAQFKAALAKLKATEDQVLVRTNPKGKELVEKFRKLLAQYQAQQKLAAANQKPAK